MGAYPLTTNRAAPTAAALLLLAACSPPTQPAPSPTTSSSAPAAPSSVNSHGLYPKALGQPAGWGEYGNPTQNTFTVDKVDVDPPCWQGGVKPRTGHTLLLHLRVTTGDNPTTVQKLAEGLLPSRWREFSRDGIIRPAGPGICVDWHERLRSPMDPNHTYAGTVELVVPDASGALVLYYPGDTAGGWEWRY
jgi:hypothetical protein